MARAARLDPDVRRGLIADAATVLLAEHDPYLVTFDQVAEAAGVSRALVHTYMGDRRGLIDAVQVQIISRLDTWVGHGVSRATSRQTTWSALVHGVFSFVDADRDAWSVLGSTGGLDHPALHGVRSRWTVRLSVDDRADDLPAQAMVSGLVGGAGTWVNRGVDPAAVISALGALLQAGEA